MAEIVFINLARPPIRIRAGPSIRDGFMDHFTQRIHGDASSIFSGSQRGAVWPMPLLDMLNRARSEDHLCVQRSRSLLAGYDIR